MQTAQRSHKSKKKVIPALIGVSVSLLLLFLVGGGKQPATPTPSPLPSPTPNQEALKQQKERYADLYCSERDDSYGSYLIPKLVDGTYNVADSKLNKGVNLSKADCLTIIDYIYQYPPMLEEIQAIIEHKYWIGMGRQELALSLGWPDDINTSDYGDGERDQWVYRKDVSGFSSYYFYIEDDIVRSYQDF